MASIWAPARMVGVYIRQACKYILDNIILDDGAEWQMVGGEATEHIFRLDKTKLSIVMKSSI